MRKTPAPPSLPIFGYFVLKGEEQGQESWRKHSGLTVSDDALPNGAHDYLNQQIFTSKRWITDQVEALIELE